MSFPFSPISQLPEELLHSVIRHVRDTSTRSTFLACLQCCKRWRDSGMPLLCKAIVLTNANLSIFLNQFSSTHCVLVSSLTVSLRLPKRGYKDREEAAFHALLQNLAAMINKMTILSRFSFAIDRIASPTRDCKLPSGILAALVQSLPPSCVDLELDTKGYDTLKPRSVHLCDELRAVLPRLRTFHIRLAYVCPALFTTSFSILEDSVSLVPVVATFLQSAIINCVITALKFRGSARTCYTAPICKAWPEARDPLAACLRQLVGRQGTYPVVERLWLKCWAPGRVSDRNGIQQRRNVLQDTIEIMKHYRFNCLDS